MDERPSQEIISQRDLLYRLALLLNMRWENFCELELWQIRNRVFVSGESVVESKIEALDAKVAADIVSNSSKRSETHKSFNDWYRKSIEVEYEATDDEIKRQYEESNRQFFEQIKHHGR